jgi:hypothetical protein
MAERVGLAAAPNVSAGRSLYLILQTLLQAVKSLLFSFS